MHRKGERETEKTRALERDEEKKRELKKEKKREGEKEMNREREEERKIKNCSTENGTLVIRLVQHLFCIRF